MERTKRIRTVRSGLSQVYDGTTWVTKRGNLCPIPKPLGCYRHFRWQQKSYARRGKGRRLDLVVDDAIFL